MGQAEQQPRRLTVEEYFALEEGSEVRHEFFEGEVFAMAGASATHNRLAGNCYTYLRSGLRGKGCEVFFESVQLAVEQGRYYNYPDVLVTCDPVDLQAERTMTAPILLIEVLSKSTENRDRSWKFNQYKQLPSLRHYLLVSQTTCLVEWYQREESGVWSFTPLALFTDEIFISELSITLRLADIYENTGISQMAIRPEPDEYR
jgi:Uma2 family endonuclease